MSQDMIVFDTATLKAPLVAILRNAAARTTFAVVPRQHGDLLLRTTTPVSPWTKSKISIVSPSFAAEITAMTVGYQRMTPATVEHASRHAKILAIGRANIAVKKHLTC